MTKRYLAVLALYSNQIQMALLILTTASLNKELIHIYSVELQHTTQMEVLMLLNGWAFVCMYISTLLIPVIIMNRRGTCQECTDYGAYVTHYPNMICGDRMCVTGRFRAAPALFFSWAYFTAV